MMKSPSSLVVHPGGEPKLDTHVTEQGAEYRAYLQSPRWQKLRRAVMLRANGKCEICLRADGTDCAHLTYDRIFNERLADLIWVCRPCHQDLDQFSE